MENLLFTNLFAMKIVRAAAGAKAGIRTTNGVAALVKFTWKQITVSCLIQLRGLPVIYLSELA